MKKWSVILILAAMGLVACSKRSARNDNVVASGVTAFNANCLNTGTFTNTLNGNCGFNNFNNTPFIQYPQTQGYYQGYSTGYASGFDACPYGSVPVYSAGLGLACLPYEYMIGMNNLVSYSWNAAAYDFSFYGYQNYYDYNSYHYNPGIAYQSCNTSAECGLGACLGLGGGSLSLGLSIGLCGGSNSGYDDYYYDDYYYDDYYY